MPASSHANAWPSLERNPPRWIVRATPPRANRTAFGAAFVLLTTVTFVSASVADTAPSCKDPTKGRWRYWMWQDPSGCDQNGQNYPLWEV
jgi:hypothetical protein